MAVEANHTIVIMEVGLNSLKSLNLTNVYPNKNKNKEKSKPLELYELAGKKN
jgi:hypothetical protein